MSADQQWLEQQGVSKEKQPIKRERGGCLSLYLGFAILMSGYTMLVLPTLISKAANDEIPVPVTSVLALGLVMIAYLVSSIAIWNWREWGLYLFGVMTFVTPMIEALIGIATMTDFIAPFVQIGIMWFLVRNKMDMFD